MPPSVATGWQEPLRQAPLAHGGASRRCLGAALRRRGCAGVAAGSLPGGSCSRLATALRADVFGTRAASAGGASGGGCGGCGADTGGLAEQSRTSEACKPSRSVPELTGGAGGLESCGSACASVAHIYGPGQQPGQQQLQQRQRQRQARLRRARQGWSTACGGVPSAGICSVGGGATGSRRPDLLRDDEICTAVAHTAVFSYLRLFGLGQYARVFVDAGMEDLGPIAHMPDAEALDLLERTHLLPGHRAKMLRAISMLHQAAVLGGSGCTNGELTGALRDEQMFRQLCERVELLILERAESEKQNQILQEENHRLIVTVRQQSANLNANGIETDQARVRVSELEQLVWAQTEQVSFLASQLQRSMQSDSRRRSGGVFGDVEKEGGLGGGGVGARRKSRSQEDLDSIASCRRKTEVPGVLEDQVQVIRPSEGAGGFQENGATPQSAPSCGVHVIRQITDGDVELIEQAAQSLAAAVRNKMILCAVGFACPGECARLPAIAAVFDDHLQQAGVDETEDQRTCTPSKRYICDHLREVMLGAKVPAEVCSAALIYTDRLQSESAAVQVRLTPGNWRKLVAASLLLGAKVWSDVAFTHDELGELLPYSADELNTLERALVQALDYNIFIEEAEYVKTCFMLRTLGSKSLPAFRLQPLGAERALQVRDRCASLQTEFRLRYPVSEPAGFCEPASPLRDGHASSETDGVVGTFESHPGNQ